MCVCFVWAEEKCAFDWYGRVEGVCVGTPGRRACAAPATKRPRAALACCSRRAPASARARCAAPRRAQHREHRRGSGAAARARALPAPRRGGASQRAGWRVDFEPFRSQRAASGQREDAGDGASMHTISGAWRGRAVGRGLAEPRSAVEGGVVGEFGVRGRRAEPAAVARAERRRRRRRRRRGGRFDTIRSSVKSESL